LQKALEKAKHRPATALGNTNSTQRRRKASQIRVDSSLMQPDVAKRGRASRVGNRFSVVSGGLPGSARR
jgi:hypothetical protein